MGKFKCHCFHQDRLSLERSPTCSRCWCGHWCSAWSWSEAMLMRCQDCELPHPQTSCQLIIFTASPGPIGVTQCWLRIKISFFIFSLSCDHSHCGLTPRSPLSLTSQFPDGNKDIVKTLGRREFLCVPSSQQWVLHITANSYHRTNITFPSSWLCPPPALSLMWTQHSSWPSWAPDCACCPSWRLSRTKTESVRVTGPATDTSRLLRAMTPTEARLRAPDTRNILWQNIFYLYRPSVICGREDRRS